MTIPLSIATRLARVTATRDHINASGATLKFYTGTMPATPDTAPTGTLLGTMALASPNIGAVTDESGVATLTATVPQVCTALATGTVGWVRVVEDATHGVMDLEAGDPLSAAPVKLSEVVVYLGGELQLLSFILTE